MYIKEIEEYDGVWKSVKRNRDTPAGKRTPEVGLFYFYFFSFNKETRLWMEEGENKEKVGNCLREPVMRVKVF